MAADYDYMDENAIDPELKCPICTSPFREPVSLSCQHTFCRECIRNWIDENHSCPTCRQCPDCAENDETIFSPVNTSIVNNQLDRLLVRCEQCHEENIQRGNFFDHQEKCSKRVVPCRSADIQCSWKGLREERDDHSAQCPFEQLRPIVDLLRNDLLVAQETQTELREQIEHQSAQIHFLLTLVNRGNPMARDCSKPYGKCQWTSRTPNRSRIVYRCAICENRIRRKFVLLHACSLNETIDCLCQECYEKQYPNPSESDGNDEEERGEEDIFE